MAEPDPLLHAGQGVAPAQNFVRCAAEGAGRRASGALSRLSLPRRRLSSHTHALVRHHPRMSLKPIESPSLKDALLLYGGDDDARLWQLTTTEAEEPQWKVRGRPPLCCSPRESSESPTGRPAPTRPARRWSRTPQLLHPARLPRHSRRKTPTRLRHHGRRHAFRMLPPAWAPSSTFPAAVSLKTINLTGLRAKVGPLRTLSSPIPPPPPPPPPPPLSPVRKHGFPHPRAGSRP